MTASGRSKVVHLLAPEVPMPDCDLADSALGTMLLGTLRRRSDPTPVPFLPLVVQHRLFFLRGKFCRMNIIPYARGRPSVMDRLRTPSGLPDASGKIGSGWTCDAAPAALGIAQSD